MTVTRSAGILPFRWKSGGLDVLLAHPGGPFWQSKDAGAWTIFKGLCEEGETSHQAAQREFKEESGFDISGDLIDLGELKQPSGKVIYAYAVEADYDASRIKSNSFTMEWPPRSGNHQEFPEVDRGAWFSLEEARVKLRKGQAGFLQRLVGGGGVIRFIAENSKYGAATLGTGSGCAVRIAA